jgi:hypothetical protein
VPQAALTLGTAAAVVVGDLAQQRPVVRAPQHQHVVHLLGDDRTGLPQRTGRSGPGDQVVVVGGEQPPAAALDERQVLHRVDRPVVHAGQREAQDHPRGPPPPDAVDAVELGVRRQLHGLVDRVLPQRQRDRFERREQRRLPRQQPGRGRVQHGQEGLLVPVHDGRAAQREQLTYGGCPDAVSAGGIGGGGEPQRTGRCCGSQAGQQLGRRAGRGRGDDGLARRRRGRGGPCDRAPAGRRCGGERVRAGLA